MIGCLGHFKNPKSTTENHQSKGFRDNMLSAWQTTLGHANASFIVGNPNANEMEFAGGIWIFGVNMAEFPIAN
jgi:hypothetical protein